MGTAAHGSPETALFKAMAEALQSRLRSEEHTSELQSLMRTSYAVFCLKKKKQHIRNTNNPKQQRQKNPTILSRKLLQKIPLRLSNRPTITLSAPRSHIK